MSPVFWRYDPNLSDEDRERRDGDLASVVIVAIVLILAAVIGVALILGASR